MDKFKDLKKIGSGSYAVVFSAKRKASNQTIIVKKIALKVLNVKEKELILAEVL